MAIDEIKQAIFKALEEIPEEDYEIGGQKIVIRGLSAYELNVYRKWKNNADELKSCSAMAKLIQLSLYKKDGSRLIGDDEVNQINGMFGTKIDEIEGAVLRVNGFNDLGVDAIIKNLRKILGDAGLRELRESINVLLPNSSSNTAPTS